MQSLGQIDLSRRKIRAAYEPPFSYGRQKKNPGRQCVALGQVIRQRDQVVPRLILVLLVAYIPPHG